MERSGRRLALIATILASLLVLPAGTALAEHVGPCALHREDGEETRHFVKRLIRCAARSWEVPGGALKAICIARRESGLDPKVVSEPEGLYVGLFQHSREMWADRYGTWAKPVWELRQRAVNGRTNAIVTIRMVNAYGWGPWEGRDC
jgi:hypothetical protein